MKKLTAKQKEYIQMALEMVMNLNNDGKQIWFEFSPHVSKVHIYYYANKKDFVSKEFCFAELCVICNYIFSISDKIYNKY